MKYLQYRREKRRIKLQEREAQKDFNYLRNTLILKAESRELERQSKCSHSYSHEIVKRVHYDCSGNWETFHIVLICKHCGKVVEK